MKSKIGFPERLLIGYLAIAAVAGGIMVLAIDGEARFGAFWILQWYSFPTTYVLNALGLDDLFGNWPSAIYWTELFTLLNGIALYAVIKTPLVLWRRLNRSANSDGATE